MIVTYVLIFVVVWITLNLWAGIYFHSVMEANVCLVDLFVFPIFGLSFFLLVLITNAFKNNPGPVIFRFKKEEDRQEQKAVQKKKIRKEN